MPKSDTDVTSVVSTRSEGSTCKLKMEIHPYHLPLCPFVRLSLDLREFLLPFGSLPFETSLRQPGRHETHYTSKLREQKTGHRIVMLTDRKNIHQPSPRHGCSEEYPKAFCQGHDKFIVVCSHSPSICDFQYICAGIAIMLFRCSSGERRRNAPTGESGL